MAMREHLRLLLGRSGRADRNRGNPRDVQPDQPLEDDFLAAILDSTRLLVLVVDCQGRILWANRVCEELLGFRGSDLIGQPVWSFLANDGEAELVRDAFTRPSGDFPPGFVDHWRTSDGQVRVIEWSNRVVRAGSELGECIVCTGLDITERERAELTLKETESRYHLMLDQVPAVVWTTDRELCFTTGIGSGLRHLGLRPGQLQMVGVSLYAYFHTSDPDNPNIAAHRRALQGESVSYDSEWLDRAFRVSVEPFRDPAGEIIGTIGIALDVTEQKQVEEALARKEQRLRAIIDSEPECVSVVAEDGTLREINPAGLKMIEADRLDDVVGKKVFGLIVSEHQQAYREFHARICQGEHGTLAFDIIGLRGTRRSMETHAVPLREPDGSILHLAVTRDITERKAAEAALQASERRFRALIENSSDGVVLLDARGIIQYASPGVFRMLGYPQDEFVGRNAFEFTHPEEIAHLQQRFAQLLQEGGLVREEVRYRHRDGRWLWLEGIGTNLLDDPSVAAVVTNLRDVTERKLAEDAIRTALREKETLLKEVHHRVKNNLAIIDGLFRLQASKSSDAKVVEALRDSQNRIRSMAAIHESLYKSAELARIDFADYARQLCRNLFRSYLADPHRVRLELELTRLELDLALAIPLGLLLNEILSNALKHAFPDGRSGRVVVEVVPEGDARFRLAVRDDGIGIPADIDLDQPGTLGLGLVTVLTRQIGGTLQWHRHPGTAIAIYFAIPANSLGDGHEPSESSRR